MTSTTKPPAETLSERLVELFCALAAIPSPSGSEAACGEVVRETLTGLGLDVIGDGCAAAVGGDCDNLYCAVPGVIEGLPLFFCAHLDTVPPTEPLRPILDNGVLRNATPSIIGADNKAAVVVLLELARTLQETNFAHAGIEFLFTVGEEQGLLGSTAFDASRFRAKTGFVFDHPGSVGSYVTAAPSRFSITATMLGRASHASIAPEAGVNAIVPLAQAIGAFPPTPTNVGVNIARIEGGRSWNVVPDSATLCIDVRSICDESARATVKALTESLEQASREGGCELVVTVDNRYVGYRLDGASIATTLVRDACNQLGITAELIETRGGSDANAFRVTGLDCINLAHGVVDFHGPDEHVAVDDLVLMHEFALTLIAAAADRTSGQVSP